jgi:hypothetical protein
MTYGITNASGGYYFAGFADNGDPQWTKDKSAAWANDHLAASAQASLLVRQGLWNAGSGTHDIDRGRATQGATAICRQGE